MKYKEEFIKIIRNKIDDKNSILEYRNNINDFKRNRKMPFEKVVYYGINKKGLSSKMEIEEFEELINMTDISSPAVLKQRLKLNGEIYNDMRIENVKVFYEKYPEEVKLFKGYLLMATDGSDLEIPNTIKTREKYNELHKEETVARITISNVFDVLNHYIIDTIIERYDNSERDMAIQNHDNVKSLELPYPIIRIKDRGYATLPDFYLSNKSNDKYIVRLKKNDYKNYIKNMKSNDEEIEVKYQYDRVRYYKDSNPEFYKIMEEKKENVKIRIVKINDTKGEEIYIATNLTKEEITEEEIFEIYKLRWEIELNYHVLKESLKIETITSSNEIIIKQDIYSQMLVFNLIQAFKNDSDEHIEQDKYKHTMKINMNMAVGFIKKSLIIILLEENEDTRNQMLDILTKKIEKYLIPIRSGRSYSRNRNKKNKYSIGGVHKPSFL